MKKLVVLVVLFLVGITAQANQVTNFDHNTERGIGYNHSKSIKFVQRGVVFIVHSNGSFTYHIPKAKSLKNSRARTTPGHNYGVSFYNNYGNNYSPKVSYDRYGNINKIGRNLITYNKYGKVQRIGDVRLRYHNKCLVRAGDMHITYDKYGRIKNTHGKILGYRHR